MFDLAVVGAGPAGASTALLCARAGLRVVIYDETQPDAGRSATETLDPRVGGFLSRMGVGWPIAGAVPSSGVISTWHGSTRETHPLFNPYGCDWHVDRRRLRAAIVDRAIIVGATFRGHKVSGRIRRDAGNWSIEHPHGVDHARLLVLATGRRRGPRTDQVRRIFADRLVAHLGWFRATPEYCQQLGRRLAIGVAACGWWYVCPSEDGSLQLAVICGPQSDEAPQVLRTVVSQTADLAGLADCALERSLTTAADLSMRTPSAGVNWMHVGDSALALDPLSGQGVLRALSGAETVAEVALSDERHREDLLRSYSSQCRLAFEESIRTSGSLYASAARATTSQFWQRSIGVQERSSLGLVGA